MVLYIRKVFLLVLVLDLKFFYFFLKLLPTQNKIVFISRQSNSISTDFRLLSDRFSEIAPDFKQKIITKRFNKSVLGSIKFYINTLTQMYHLATARVCIIDSYCLSVSVLTHKEELLIIQIWHAIGKIKQSGHQTLNRKYGRIESDANILKMHNNYDYIVAGAKYWNKYYCASFGVLESRLLNFGLPRIDYLINGANNIKERVLEKYPNIYDKPIIIYAPTFRKKSDSGYKKIIENFDYDKFNLIVKLHPNEQQNIANRSGLYLCPEFNASELLIISEYVISDYSSIAFEAAVVNKKILFYLFDYEEYLEKNGLNINLYEEAKDLIFKDEKVMFDYIENQEYPLEYVEHFKNKFLPNELGNSTELITNFIIEKVREY